jgi:hypothetical protein
LAFLAFTFLVCCIDRHEVPSSNSKSDADIEKILLVARKKIEELKLDGILIKSQLAIVCIYKKKEILEYDSIGILNFQLTFVPIAILKGTAKTEKIYIHVHSPGLSKFGYDENYGKKFLIFLTNDQFGDGHYAEGYDFIKAVILE